MNREQALRIAFDQARLLLSAAALRTAPKSFAELAGGSNRITRNAAYLHPDALSAIGLSSTPGVRIAADSLIVCTRLMPPFGVIYGPLFNIFLETHQRPEDYADYNVAVMHPELVHGTQMLEQGRAAIQNLNEGLDAEQEKEQRRVNSEANAQFDAVERMRGNLVEGD